MELSCFGMQKMGGGECLRPRLGGRWEAEAAATCKARSAASTSSSGGVVWIEMHFVVAVVGTARRRHPQMRRQNTLVVAAELSH